MIIIVDGIVQEFSFEERELIVQYVFVLYYMGSNFFDMDNCVVVIYSMFLVLENKILQ